MKNREGAPTSTRPTEPCLAKAGPSPSARRFSAKWALAALFLLASFLGLPTPGQESSYDLFLKSDYGRSLLWINTRTGDFRWQDEPRRLDITGRGTLEFPNLGPIVFTFAGTLPGYDWVSLSVKIYGTTATGYLAAFPEGTPVRKIVSNFYDRNTRDDKPPEPRPQRKPKKPEVLEINPKPSEIPKAGPPR